MKHSLAPAAALSSVVFGAAYGSDSGFTSERWSNIQSIKGYRDGGAGGEFLAVTAIAKDGKTVSARFKFGQDLVRENCLRALYAAFAAERTNVKAGVIVEALPAEGEPSASFVRACEFKVVE